MNFNYTPPEIYFPNDYLKDLSNSLASSFSVQKDKLIFGVLKENGADIYNLTSLMKECKFIRQEGTNYQILNYKGQDLIIFYDPDMTCKDGIFKVEIRYKKLY